MNWLNSLVEDYLRFEPLVDKDSKVFTFLSSGNDLFLHCYSRDPLYAIFAQALFPTHSKEESECFEALELSIQELNNYKVCEKCVVTYQDLNSSINDFELQMAIGALAFLKPFKRRNFKVKDMLDNQESAISLVKSYLNFRGNSISELLFFLDPISNPLYLQILEEEREEMELFFQEFHNICLKPLLSLLAKGEVVNSSSSSAINRYLVKLVALEDSLEIGTELPDLEVEYAIIAILDFNSFSQEVSVIVNEDTYQLLSTFSERMGYKGLNLILDATMLADSFSKIQVETALQLFNDGGSEINSLEKAVNAAEKLFNH